MCLGTLARARRVVLSYAEPGAVAAAMPSLAPVSGTEWTSLVGWSLPARDVVLRGGRNEGRGMRAAGGRYGIHRVVCGWPFWNGGGELRGPPPGAGGVPEDRVRARWGNRERGGSRVHGREGGVRVRRRARAGRVHLEQPAAVREPFAELGSRDGGSRSWVWDDRQRVRDDRVGHRGHARAVRDPEQRSLRRAAT